MAQFNPASTLFFLCDLQTKFRPAIFAFDHVVNTTNKLLKLAKILGIEVVATTQNTRGAQFRQYLLIPLTPDTLALGPIDPAIDLLSLGDLHLGTFDKTLFSMLTADVKQLLDSRPHIRSVVLFGIESHICITQTALSLLALPARIKPYVVADGVSSTNAHEIPLALDRLRQEGAVVATSESLAFQLIGDAGRPEFKTFSALVKQEKERTTAAVNTFLGPKDDSTSPYARSSM
ncbi:Isochorismatase hydrolase [Pluteus cervinus]|uniref:Isochorismatase hydrolase n=1 Tax=Pluteus cervinus TaxID=181527 RepID=A0ACD3B8Q8_9AGAR|nr:Isochorismatase hydrolase [Pluteus cervinus]